MVTVNTKLRNIPTQVLQIFANITANPNNPICNSPGCTNQHKWAVVVRIASAGVYLRFCSEGCKQAASQSWGIKF